MVERTEEIPSLVTEACKALGIDLKYLFAYKVYPENKVVVVTVGGFKASYTKGEKVERPPIEKITGVYPAGWEEAERKRQVRS